MKQFIRYTAVGIVNTLLHWLVFALVYYTICSNQALSNLVAFCIAVTFSFFVNARLTFQSTATTARYIKYIVFMGVISGATGWLGDRWSAPPLATLAVFSAISLICGFLYSKLFLFKEKQC